MPAHDASEYFPRFTEKAQGLVKANHHPTPLQTFKTLIEFYDQQKTCFIFKVSQAEEQLVTFLLEIVNSPECSLSEVANKIIHHLDSGNKICCELAILLQVYREKHPVGISHVTASADYLDRDSNLYDEFTKQLEKLRKKDDSSIDELTKIAKQLIQQKQIHKLVKENSRQIMVANSFITHLLYEEIFASEDIYQEVLNSFAEVSQLFSGETGQELAGICNAKLANGDANMKKVATDILTLVEEITALAKLQELIDRLKVYKQVSGNNWVPMALGAVSGVAACAAFAALWFLTSSSAVSMQVCASVGVSALSIVWPIALGVVGFTAAVAAIYCVYNAGLFATSNSQSVTAFDCDISSAPTTAPRMIS